MGQAYIELGNFDEALIRLLRAHDISLEQHKNFGDDITTAIRLAKRLRFEKFEAKKSEQECELQVRLAAAIFHVIYLFIAPLCQDYLENLIKLSFKRKSIASPDAVEGDIKQTNAEEYIDNTECQRRVSQVQELFHKVRVTLYMG